MYNAAVIGISGFGTTHYQDLKDEVESGNATIIAATVINQEEEQEKCAWLQAQGTKLFTDWQEMLAWCRGRLDICFIPTGIAMHAPMSIAAMEAGANVFVEKPVAATVQEVETMREASIRTGKFIAVGYQLIFQPHIQQIKKMLIDNCLGELKSIKCYGLWCRNSSYYSRNNWAGKCRVNGNWVLDSPFNNALAHYLNLICFLAGTQQENSAVISSIQAELYRANAIESADTACIRITTDKELPLYFYVSHACPGSSSPLTVITGENGTLTIDEASLTAQTMLNDGKTETMPLLPYSQFRTNIMNALRQRLTDPKAFICGLDIAGTQTICCNGAHESSAVNEIQPQFTKTVIEPDNATHIEIDDITNIVKMAFDTEKLFSEIRVPWAKPGKVIDMTSYRQFNGGRIK